MENNTNSNLSTAKKFWLVIKVLEVRLRFIAILVATGLVIGYWDTIRNYWDKWTRSAAPAEATIDSDSEYYCPMHPNVVRAGLDPNGEIPKCPICGMRLSLRKKGEAAELPDGVISRVQISPERIRLAGIQTVPVTYHALSKELRTVGFVGYDESRLSRIVSRVGGYLERLYFDRTWITVKEGDPLAEIYSPELYSTVRELLAAVTRGSKDLEKSGRERLRLLGVGDGEIDEIIQSGRANHVLVIRSPRGGHVIRKEVVKGAHVESGMTLFEVADLSIVWVEAEVYEKDIPFIRVGQEVEATVEAMPNRVFAGKVSLVHPHLEAMTRTNAVRVELENPKHELRPGMFATVHIKVPIAEIEPFKTLAAQAPLASHVIRSDSPREYFACPSNPEVMMDRAAQCPKCKQELERRPLNEDERLVWWCPMHPKVTSDQPDAVCDDCSGMKLVPKLLLLAKPGEVLAVPDRAVVDTGSKKIVYVEREPGLFDGVLVELGPRTSGFYPVVSGLEPSQRIAAAGAFLIDAETRLNPAAAAAYVGASGGAQTSKASAVRGAKNAASSRDSRPTGRTSKAAKQPATAHKFTDEELKNINELVMTDREAAQAQRFCPITDEPLGSMGVPQKMIVQGQPVFLCCSGCESKVNREPGKVLQKVAELRSRGEQP